MKPIHYLSLLLLLLLASCQDEENQSCSFSIKLTAPDDYPGLAFNDIEVTLTSKSGQGTTYTTISSPTGIATFHVEYGEYSASVHHQTPAGVIFNGRVENILLSPEKGYIAALLKLPLSRAQTNALVIKEIYYGGCKDKNGKNYRKDQYITLYNNSTETLYLDGLCIAMIDYQNNSGASPWMEHTDRTRIPVFDFTWQFPGTGTEHPLAPGAEITIATNAVDHTGGEYGHPNSVNLSAVGWGFYDSERFTEQVITPGVKHMKLIASTNEFGNWFQFGVSNMPIMVFSPQWADANSYIQNPANRQPVPLSDDQDTKYLMIPREWVVDCVECTKNAATAAFHRVPVELDAQAIYMPGGSDKGTSVIRRSTSTGDGRIVYQDTNNSSEDMIVNPTPALKK